MNYKARDYLGIGSLFILIITVTIALVIWAIPLYQFSLKHLNIPETVGISFEQIMKNYYILLEYLHFPWIKTLSLPDFSVSASGALHFYEVKILFYLNYALLFISLISGVVYLRKLKQTASFWKLIRPFQIAIFIPFVLLFVLALDFNWMFEMFHEILFNNDAWLFNPATDPIITVLPQEFFMYTFILAFIIVETCFISGYFYFKKRAY